MPDILVDANVILDIFLDDPVWGDWSADVLNRYGKTHTLVINPIIYTEVSVGFARIEELDQAISAAGFVIREIPKEALFLAGKVYLSYRRNHGTKTSPLPDFLIGAQAAVLGWDLITRDLSRYQTYFHTVTCLSP